MMEGKMAGDLGALAFFQRGMGEERDLSAQNPANKDLQRELGIGYIFLGNYYRATGAWGMAESTYTEGLKRMLAIRDVNNRIWYNYVGVAYLDLGDALAHRGDYAEATKNYQLALTIFSTEVGKSSRNSDWQHNLALNYERLGYVADSQSNPGRARDYFRQAMQTFDTTLNSNDQDPINYNASPGCWPPAPHQSCAMRRLPVSVPRKPALFQARKFGHISILSPLRRPGITICLPPSQPKRRRSPSSIHPTRMRLRACSRD